MADTADIEATAGGDAAAQSQYVDVEDGDSNPSPNAAEAALMGIPLNGDGGARPPSPSSTTSSEGEEEQEDKGEEPLDDAAEMVVEYSPAPKPEDPSEQGEHMKELESKANLDGFKEGEIWYIVSAKWWKRWKQYVQYDKFSSSSYMGAVAEPGPVDNEDIIESGSENDPRIKKSCSENYDFHITSKEMWATLKAWYGGGPEIARKVIASAWNPNNLTVEVRPLALRVLKSSAKEQMIDVTFSKVDTVGKFKEEMCKKMNLDPKEVRVWDYHGSSKYKLLEDMTQQLSSAQILDGQQMFIEEKGEDGKFAEEKSKALGSYSSASSYYNTGGPTHPGTTGLINLGNTCFMNSSLQCLSNTSPLANFFLTKKYKEDLNKNNPLGMNGELADAYSDMIDQLWSGNHSAIAPRGFKHKLDRFAPQFAGYQQHDSQELLAFLLDGLHEDLNRIQTKPYTENPEVDDRPEAEVAQEAWAKHRQRNDSIIVDWFQGQLKSTLVCPKCQRVSITFDPFMYLSLPLPMKTTRLITVFLLYMDPLKKPLKMICEVGKHGSIKELENKVAELGGVKPGSIVITDVYNCRFFKQFLSDEPLDTIQDRDAIWAYELLKSEDVGADISYFPVIHRKEESYSYPSAGHSRHTLFGLPFVLSVSNASKLTYSKLQELVTIQIQRFLKPKGEAEADEAPEQESDSDTDEEVLQDANLKDSKGIDSDDDDSKVNSTRDRSGSEDSPSIKKKRKSQDPFIITPVDNYGSGGTTRFAEGDNVLDLEKKQTLGVNWSNVDIYFDEKAAKEFDVHETCNRPPEQELDASITLDKCLDLFTIAEQLGPEDPWYCSKCKEFQQATKKFDLWTVPPILVIHLKRFSYKNRHWREKLETLVEFPLQSLDLTRYVLGPNAEVAIYDLYAVSNHYGSLGGGHYTAFAQNKDDKNWYKFDDSYVSKVEDSKVQSSSAYVLFYRRRDVQDPQPDPTPAASSGNLKDEEEEENHDVQKMEDDSEDTQEMDLQDVKL